MTHLNKTAIRFFTIFIGIPSFFINAQTTDLKKLSESSLKFYENHDNDSAIIVAERLISEAKQKDSVHYIIKGFCIKGFALRALNKTKEAIADYYTALKLCVDPSENVVKASLYNNLGAVNYEQKNTALAKSYFKEEIRLRKEIGDTAKIADCLINLSAVYRALNEPDSSGYILDELKPLLKKTRNEKLEGYYNLAKGAQFQTLYKRDSVPALLDSSIIYYSNSLAIWLKSKSQAEALLPLFNMGLIYHSKKKYVQALFNYKKAEEIVNGLKLKNERLTVLGNLAELYSDMKDYKRSADYFRSYIETKDSILKGEVNYYALKLDKQMKAEQNREMIQKQKLELIEKDKRIYLFLFLAALSIGTLIVILFYLNFRKKLNYRIEEAKKKFFANVVHEVKTPLSMIQAPLAVLKQKASLPEDVANFELAERNVNRLNELISQMLDISKIDSDKYILNETFGDLDIFFKQLIGNYAKIALEKNIGIVADLNFEQKAVLFDKDVLEKIAGNLLGNAIKYSHPGSMVGVNASSEETENGIKFMLNVWDTGIGISAKEQQIIFNRFYRSENTAGKTKGSGIGLALVKDLVDIQKGSIDLVSEENKGSSFTVTLRFRRAEVLTPSVNLLKSGENTCQVLMVEDDKDILEFNARYLEKNNFRVLRSSSTEEAMRIIEKNLPDLIVSDLMMPGIDGLGFLKMIKENPETNHIPFIILSARSSPSVRMEVLQAGAQNFMVKPFLPDELVALVANQIEILRKRKKEFKQLIEEIEKPVEEKVIQADPYVQKLLGIILDYLDDPQFSVEKLADLMAINRSHFQRKVKAITGLSPSEIIKSVRMEKAKEMLLQKTGNVTEVAYSTGFSSQSYFTKCFTEYYGVSPTQILNKEKVK
ncbi:MAG: hybrid sensor histidine kinase/response regulator transcription factor [Bacteroidia bacterium]